MAGLVWRELALGQFREIIPRDAFVEGVTQLLIGHGLEVQRDGRRFESRGCREGRGEKQERRPN